MLKHEFQALFRAPWRTGLFALLLAAAVAAASLGGGLLAATAQGMAELSAQYTTIAVVKNNVGKDPAQCEALLSLAEQTKYGRADRRRIYGGYSPGIHTATSLKETWELEINSRYSTYEEYEYIITHDENRTWDIPGNASYFDNEYEDVVLIATCMEDIPDIVEEWTGPEIIELPGGTIIEINPEPPDTSDILRSGNWRFRIDEVLTAHESYEIPETMLHAYFEKDDPEFGDALSSINYYEVGKQYLIVGKIEWHCFSGEAPWFGTDGYTNFSRMPTETGEYVRTLTAKVVYRTETVGTLEETLAGPDGALMEERMRKAEIGQNSVTVFATQRLNGFVQFNRNDLYITAGRDFTAEEHAEGAPVCVISEKLAQLNGLSVGDTVPFSLYEVFASCDTNNSNIDNKWYRVTSVDPIELQPEREYTIVGLFNTPEWQHYENVATFSQNTVFIPADPEMALESIYVPPMMYAVIVQNGHGEDFLAEMEALEPGSSNHFVIYDQGYSEVAPAMEAFAKNARLVAAGCAAVFALAGGMFLALARAKHRHDLGVMRSLGATKQKAFTAFLVRCAVPVLFGGALGCAAAQLLFGRAAALLGEEGLVAQPVGAMWLIALGCALALTGLAAAVGAGLVKKKPQELMREGKE
ncbi:MAG: ABC transporter permease [Christensenellales bacterium]